MQNPVHKPGILSAKLKTLTSCNYGMVEYFLLNVSTHFLLTNVYKRCSRFFKFCLDLELFAQIKKTGFYTLVETSFLHFYW